MQALSLLQKRKALCLKTSQSPSCSSPPSHCSALTTRVKPAGPGSAELSPVMTSAPSAYPSCRHATCAPRRPNNSPKTRSCSCKKTTRSQNSRRPRGGRYQTLHQGRRGRPPAAPRRPVPLHCIAHGIQAFAPYRSHMYQCRLYACARRRPCQTENVLQSIFLYKMSSCAGRPFRPASSA